MILHQIACSIGLTSKTGLKNGLVFCVDISIFTRQRERQMSVALALRIEHCTQSQHPRTVAADRERCVEGRVRRNPARAQA